MYIDFWLRDDVYWSDCHQFTTADVKFSLQDAEAQLAAKGCPSPWFSQTTWPVKNVTVYDDFYCRVYLIDKSIWLLHTIGGSIMIPRHIWEPLIASKTCTELQGWGPDLDPNMVGTGPFLFVEHVENEYVLLVKNTKFFLYDDMEIDVPHVSALGTDLQSYVGLRNRGVPPQTVTVTLEVEGPPVTWNLVGSKPTTIPGKSWKGVNFEAEIQNYGGLLGGTHNFRVTTSAPIRGVPVTRTRTTHCTRPGDINSDNSVGLKDAVRLSTAYGGTYNSPPPEDINLDCSVGLADAVLLSTHYGQTSP
jgi:hypothetical protein